jgi:PRTRC genetic system protein E
MSFLTSLRPIMRGSSSITVTLTTAPNDALAVLVTSKLDQFDPETTDTGRAALQAALALPLRIVIPSGADADAEFLQAMTRYQSARAPALDDLQNVLDTLAQAQQAAKAAAASKKPAAAKPAATKPAKASAPPKPADGASGDTADGDADEGNDEVSAEVEGGATTGAEPTSSGDLSPVSPAPAAASSLFD